MTQRRLEALEKLLPPFGEDLGRAVDPPSKSPKLSKSPKSGTNSNLLA